MNKLSTTIVFVAAMVLVIVLADILFFRHHTTQRLVANIGIVLVFLAFYWRFIKRN